MNGLYFEGKLPVELFLLIASYCVSTLLSHTTTELGGERADLPRRREQTDTLIPLTHVCTRWRLALLAHPSLWSLGLNEDHPVEVASFESVERVRAVAARAKGSLKALHVGFNICGERASAWDVMPVVATLRQVS